MQYTLGLVKSEKQMILKTFNSNQESNSTKVVDLTDIPSQEINGLFYDKSLDEDVILESLKDAINFYPIRPAQDFALNSESFESLETEEAQKYYQKIQSSWVLQNNLRLIDDLTNVVKRLKQLWPNNRGDFFEELWFLLKSNLGCTSMTLIYNDLKKATKENEKDKLIKVKVEGSTVPNPTEGGEPENAIFENYQDDFGLPFHICDHDLDKGELVATLSIKQSPILLMGRLNQLSQLQKSLVKTLAEALDEFI